MDKQALVTVANDFAMRLFGRIMIGYETAQPQAQYSVRTTVRGALSLCRSYQETTTLIP